MNSVGRWLPMSPTCHFDGARPSSNVLHPMSGIDTLAQRSKRRFIGVDTHRINDRKLGRAELKITRRTILGSAVLVLGGALIQACSSTPVAPTAAAAPAAPTATAVPAPATATTAPAAQAAPAAAAATELTLGLVSEWDMEG